MSSQASSSVVLPPVLTDDGSSGGSDTSNRSDPDRWYFAKEKLESTPSRRSGVDPDKELTYRQQSANFIQDIGQRLQVNQLCINTAIVYMHRFYMFHSFTQFHRNAVSAASIFLAAKVEEQPRKLEHVIKVAHYCLHRDHHPQIDTKSEQYLEQSAELVMNENILLQTLGFDVAIDHPHTHVVKCCQLVRASKDLAQTSYFMATNSLHLTTMSLQYKPTVVACVCIHLACKWSSWEIPRSKEGKDWFWYVDDTVTTELLEKLTTDFLQIFNKSPSRLKKKIISLSAATSSSLSLTSMPYHGFDSSPGQHHGPRSRSPSPKRPGSQKPSSSQPGVPGKPKPHGMPMPHHQIKLPSGHYSSGSSGSSGNKHSSHPPHAHPPSHPSSGKPPHPGIPPGNLKDPHHPHHAQANKNPFPAHGHGPHGAHGQYPHGSRPGMPPSGSSQAHHGHGIHSKPPVPGSTSSSSHPYSTSSSSSMKNIQAHPSKPPHMPPTGSSKMPPNQVPGAVKNQNQPMYHSSQAHMKKPYTNETRPEFGMSKREGPPTSGMHHAQNHARPHDKLGVGENRHHTSSSGMPSSGDARSGPHHNMPYMGQEMERPGGSSSGQKMPYMDNRSGDGTEMSRHRNMPPESKRPNVQASSTATNGSKSESVLGASGGSGAGESHVPSKSVFRPPGGSAFRDSSQDVGAKYHADGFGGEFGSGFSSNSNILSIEDRRKRRHDALTMGNAGTGSGPSSNKRARSDAYSLPASSLLTNSLFSPEELSESSKRLSTQTSQFSPSAVEGTGAHKSEKSLTAGIGFGGATEADLFGTSDIKSEMRRINPSEFQAPDLLQPINDSAVIKTESLSTTSGNAPRAASLFSPEFTQSNSATIKLSPSTDIHKRDVFGVGKHENAESASISQQGSSIFSEGGSHVSFTGRLSSSPKRDDGNEDSSHSSKKAKKKKKEHKHKHREEKKHKKDKHREKKEHRSKEKHSSAPLEVSNDVASHKIKIKLGRDDTKSTTVQPSSRHSSSKSTNSTSSSASVTPGLTGLKVKISSKGRVSSVDDDVKQDKMKLDPSPTPCCPGFGPCLTCNRDSSEYSYFSPPPLTLKIAKNKETTSKSSKDTRDSKKSKDKSSKTSSSTSSAYHPMSAGLVGSRPPSSSNHFVHKNGVEKPSKKKDKSAPLS